MRKFMMLSALSALSFAGCQIPHNKATCGFHFEILKPPTLNTEMPVLIQSSSPQVGAHPIGSVSGPVQEGQYLHSPATPMSSGLVPQAPLRRLINQPCNAPCDPKQVLTHEDWCIYEAGKAAKKMPQSN